MLIYFSRTDLPAFCQESIHDNFNGLLSDQACPSQSLQLNSRVEQKEWNENGENLMGQKYRGPAAISSVSAVVLLGFLLSSETALN